MYTEFFRFGPHIYTYKTIINTISLPNDFSMMDYIYISSCIFQSLRGGEKPNS